MERTITINGKPFVLEGHKVKVQEKAPDFKVVDRSLKELTLNDFSGKIKLISVTPSIDTPVCDAQAKKFEELGKKFEDALYVINISMDLPFALTRFFNESKLSKIILLSDHKYASFGLNYGVLIRDLRLLARSIFIIDERDTIRYYEIVPELTMHPDYSKVVTALEELGLRPKQN